MELLISSVLHLQFVMRPCPVVMKARLLKIFPSRLWMVIADLGYRYAVTCLNRCVLVMLSCGADAPSRVDCERCTANVSFRTCEL